MDRLLLWLVFAFVVLTGQASAQQAGMAPCNAASLNVTAYSSNVQLTKCAPSALLMNIGTVEAFYSFGATSALAVATTNSYSIPASSYQWVVVGTNAEWIAAVTASSTTTLRITQATQQ